MSQLTLDELKLLGEQSQNPSISIFLPTHRAGRDTQQDPIRYRNLLREAERRLLERGMRTPDVAALLKSAEALLEDGSFWPHLKEGLAVYVGPSDFHVYRLPFKVEEQVVIDTTYYMKPVLPYFTKNGHYFILAISQDEVRMFEGTRDTVAPYELPANVPTSLDAALPNEDYERRTSLNASSGILHGHGGGDEEVKERLERYFNVVDAGLRPFYTQMHEPWVLAGVEYLLPIYRRVSEYKNILPDGIEGNPELLRAEELQEKAWPIVEPYFRREFDNVLAQYGQWLGTGRASHALEEVIPAAYFGRIDTIVVAVDAQVWGQFDRDAGTVVQHAETQKEPADIALLDAAVTQTLLNGGAVFGVTQDQLPADTPVLALFRY